MIRLPIAPSRIAPRVALTREERHYLLDVLRLEPGGRLEVFDGKGGAYPATLSASGELVLGERRDSVPLPAPLTLAQGLAKGEKMDLVVQKATELGASAIAPFSCERAVVRLGEERAAARLERWRRIAAAAAAQCGRSDVPDLREPVPFRTALEHALEEGARPIVLYENEKERRLAHALLHAPGAVWIFAGPEGGFSRAEIEIARELGADLATLGPRILRAETVALAALAVAQFLRGDFA